MATTINQISGMPQVNTALSGWQSTITLEVITQTIDQTTFLPVETKALTTFKGTVQPLSAEQVQLKPDGQRSWEWLQIHAVAGSLNLQTNDRIVFNGVQFKVMGIFDYSLNGFIEYHLVKDYQE